MGYGDYTPPGGHHPKKPLSKAALKKIQEAYLAVDAIENSVKEQERQERKKSHDELQSMLNELF